MKNVILLNNRSLHLYDFKELKKDYNLRISAVLFEDSYKTLSNDIKESLDNIYVLPDIISDEQKFPAFPKKSLYPIIESELSRFKNTWILASDELNVLTAAFLRKKYSLSGTSMSIIINYKNKLRQKESLTKAGIQIPKFIPVTRSISQDKIKTTYENLTRYLGNPFILKPVDMAGTIGVEKIETYVDFVEYFIKYKFFSQLIAEEFITGQLYHCDFILQNGKYFFEEVSEYLHNGLAFLKGYNHGSLLLHSNNPLRSSIIDFCKKANSHLGLKTGCSHFEAFVTKDQKIVFLEAAARPAGSMVPLIFTKMFRRNYLNAALLTEIQETPIRFKAPDNYYFWIFFPMKSGIVKNLKQPLLRSHFTIQWLTSIDHQVSYSPYSISERSGVLVANNKDYNTLKTDFYSLRNFDAIENF